MDLSITNATTSSGLSHDYFNSLLNGFPASSFVSTNSFFFSPPHHPMTFKITNMLMLLLCNDSLLPSSKLPNALETAHPTSHLIILFRVLYIPPFLAISKFLGSYSLSSYYLPWSFFFSPLPNWILLIFQDSTQEHLI